MKYRGITKREIMFSIIIFAIFITTGFLISNHIKKESMDKIQNYETAILIENDSNELIYNMNTERGYVFASGKLKALDPVKNKYLPGKYSYIRIEKQVYTTYYNGKTFTHSWKYDSEKEYKSKNYKFCGVKNPNILMDKIDEDEVKTRYSKLDDEVRYVYYVKKDCYKGAIFTKLKNGKINRCYFYNGESCKSLKERLIYESKIGNITFWIIWVLTIGFIIIGFYYINNDWLED